MSLHRLTNFEIKRYYQNQPKLNLAHSRNKLLKIKNGAYIITHHESTSIGSHCVALQMDDNDVTNIDNLRVKHVSRQTKNKQATKISQQLFVEFKQNVSIIRKYFSIGFIDFMPKDKVLLDYVTSFSPNNYERNDKFVLKCFQ